MVPYMTPMMAEHWLSQVGLSPSDHFNIANDEMVDKVVQAALLCKNMVSELEDMDTIPGYIIYEEFKKEAKQDLLQIDNKVSNKNVQIDDKQTKQQDTDKIDKENKDQSQ